jgi:hypothetical protein
VFIVGIVRVISTSLISVFPYTAVRQLGGLCIVTLFPDRTVGLCGLALPPGQRVVQKMASASIVRIEKLGELVSCPGDFVRADSACGIGVNPAERLGGFRVSADSRCGFNRVCANTRCTVDLLSPNAFANFRQDQ